MNGRGVGGSDRSARAEARLAWTLVSPALATIGLVAVFPMLWTCWEALHRDDLRLPWLGRPVVGFANFADVVSDARFWSAIAHTTIFAGISVPLELAAGLLLALVLHRVSRARGLVRTAVLLPWAIPTVVAALVWRFMFESPAGLATMASMRFGVQPPTWFADPIAAWVPIVLADAWKTTPFVAILMLAGLQQIDPAVYEAAHVDGAGPWRQLLEVTLPLIRPSIVVAFVFRMLDAFRVFDVVYVMTGGGPGTATEPIAVYTFASLLQHLRFGFGSALSVIVFAVAFLFALASIRVLGGESFVERS